MDSTLMKKLLFILFLSPLAVIGQKSYWTTSRTTFDGKNAFVSLPASYADSAPKRYPVILFIPGNGEVGSDTNKLKQYGPHRYNRGSGWVSLREFEGDHSTTLYQFISSANDGSTALKIRNLKYCIY